VVDRIDLAVRVVYVTLYLAVVASFLLVAFPGARLRLVQLGRQQVYAYRVGVHRGKYARTEAVWSALTRDDLPAEPAA
jgi:hypothetical protein